jgi:hypothetical protein
LPINAKKNCITITRIVMSIIVIFTHVAREPAHSKSCDLLTNKVLTPWSSLGGSLLLHVLFTS